MKGNITTFGIMLVVILLGAVSYFTGVKERDTLGSVSAGSEYHSTTTDSNWNSTPNRMISDCTQAVGNVVITGATAGSAFKIKDATSSTDISSTTIASFLGTATAGTYAFDSIVLRGGVGVVVTSGNVASTTITCR